MIICIFFLKSVYKKMILNIIICFFYEYRCNKIIKGIVGVLLCYIYMCLIVLCVV